MSDNANRIIELFDQASRKSPAEREALLVEACKGDPELRAQIDSLLAAHEAATGFLKVQPLVAPSPMMEKVGQNIGRY